MDKKSIIEQFGANENDVGSIPVQIAIITQVIKNLTAHLKTNKKDYNTKRSLYRYVSQQKSLLSYLKSKNFDKYKDLVGRLGIRG